MARPKSPLKRELGQVRQGKGAQENGAPGPGGPGGRGGSGGRVNFQRHDQSSVNRKHMTRDALGVCGPRSHLWRRALLLPNPALASQASGWDGHGGGRHYRAGSLGNCTMHVSTHSGQDRLCPVGLVKAVPGHRLMFSWDPFARPLCGWRSGHWVAGGSRLARGIGKSGFQDAGEKTPLMCRPPAAKWAPCGPHLPNPSPQQPLIKLISPSGFNTPGHPTPLALLVPSTPSQAPFWDLSLLPNQ